MHPILLQLGSLSIKTYGFFIALGFLLGIAFSLKEARRLSFDPQLVLDISFYMILGAIVGSRLFYVLTHMHAYRNNPLDAFKIWEGGLTFFGGFILAVIACAWMVKKHGLKIWATLDLFAPALSIGVFFGRLGCFFAGCCYGKACSLPWAVTFTNPDSLAKLNVPLHPVQLYCSAGAAVTFLILLASKNKKSFDGQLTLIWIACYSGFRLIEEMFRGDVRGDLIFNRYPASQVMALILLIAAAVLFPILKKKNAGSFKEQRRG
ncbi:MAG: prolipoprotein diacylglyceryl transferase [Pseudomonadota bacterium]